jgi:riboflavin kinase/FMN adenylyltransferase
MKVFRNIDTLPAFRKAVLTIGTFDGVHLGHQQIIRQLLEESDACGGESVLLTFYPHPRHIVQPDQSLEELTTLEERILLLSSYGLQNLVVVPFTSEFASLSAEDYIRDFLVARFNPDAIIIGYDHKFGNKREGDFQLLEKLSEKYGYRVKEISEKLINDAIISSTRIRKALQGGELEEANELLGHPYFFSGRVIPGNQLGRTIGFPTANLQIAEKGKLLPANGVYAITAKLEGRNDHLNGMMNIGTRPTVDGSFILPEVHLFNFDQDIYGRHLTVWIHHFLRDEQKFSGIEALKTQLKSDQGQSLKLLESK